MPAAPSQNETRHQKEKLYRLLRDCVPHRSDEIIRTVYGGDHKGAARYGARAADLRNGDWPGKFRIEMRKPSADSIFFCWPDAGFPTLYWLQMLPFEEWINQDEARKAREYDRVLFGDKVAAIQAIPAFKADAAPVRADQPLF